MKCIFCNIVNHLTTTDIIYEDDHLIAFYDIKPSAKIHILLVPKKHIISLTTVNQEDTPYLTSILLKANKVASLVGLTSFKSIINTGLEAGQTIFHLHMHILSSDYQGF